MAPESELDERAAAARAEIAYAALQELQGFAAERRELRASGIAQHTIDALYPQSYEHLAAGALAHLRSTGHSHLYDLRHLMHEVSDVSEEIMCGHVEHLTRTWEAAYPLPNRAGVEQLALEDFLYEAFGETSEARGIVDDFTLLLWGAWICMRYRPQLDAEKQVDADFLMLWVTDNMLPALGQLGGELHRSGGEA